MSVFLSFLGTVMVMLAGLMVGRNTSHGWKTWAKCAGVVLLASLGKLCWRWGMMLEGI